MTATHGSRDAEQVTRLLRRKSRDALIMVVVVALFGPLLLLTQYYFSQRTSSVYTPVVDTTSRLVISMRWAQSDLRLDRAYGFPGAEDRLRARENDARAALAQLDQLVGDDPDFAPTLDRMTDAAEEWWAYTESVAGTTPESAPGQSPVPGPENLDALADFTRFVTAADGLLALATDKRVEMRTWRTVILVGGSALAIVIVLLVSALIVRDTRRTAIRISDPIEALDRVARSDTRGERGARAPTDSGPAEIRALAEAFNNLLDTRDDYEQTRDEYVGRLEELDRQKDDFVSTVSHELRTPLASIVGYTEMLEDGDAGELTAGQLRLVAVIRRNSERLRGLIEDLLVLSRVEGGGLEIDHSRVSLGSVVAGVLESCGPVAAGAGITVREDLPADRVEVEGDAVQLERAVTNLVSNAIKFTPSGGTVEVRLRSDPDGAAVVEVADTGIGIPAAEQGHLGTRFFRSSTAQQQSIPGTGLGLSIVRAIAQSHEGDLTFESVEGEGTTFRLRLPTWGEPAATDAGGSAASSR